MENDKNTLLIVIGAVVLLLLLGGSGMGGYGMMGIGMGFEFLFMLLFWVAVVWLVVSLTNAGQPGKKDSSDPLEILKRRYAKGEISKEQFEEMKKELE